VRVAVRATTTSRPEDDRARVADPRDRRYTISTTRFALRRSTRAHCVRINRATSAAHKVAQVAERAKRRHAMPHRRQLGLAAQAPPDLEFSNPVEALVTAATSFVELMERLDFTDFKVSMKPPASRTRIASTGCGEEDRLPLHLGITRPARSGRRR